MNSLMRCLAGLSAALLCGCSTMNTSPKVSFAGIDQLAASPALPDPLVMGNGRKVTTARDWNNERRPELKALFAHYMYGEIPPKPSRRNFDTRVVDKKFLNGAATLKLAQLLSVQTPVRAIALIANEPFAFRSKTKSNLQLVLRHLF